MNTGWTATSVQTRLRQYSVARHWTAFPRDRLVVAIGISVLVHLVLLLMRFTPPAAVKFKAIDPQLEVILLNQGTEARPRSHDVLAQVDSVGGGDRDQGRARSPLPAQARIEDGDALMRQRQRVADLEAQQRSLLALSSDQPARIDVDRPGSQQAPQVDGADERNVDAAIARLQAQIDRQISDYNKRPRRLTYGINAKGVSYARYVENWAARIEKLGTEHYPPAARGKMYDTMIITVEIDRKGEVVDVLINRRSKFEPLNRAVRQIVLAGAPYEAFSADMARDGDILQIVRTWHFTNDTLATAAIDSEKVIAASDRPVASDRAAAPDRPAAENR